MSAIGNASGYVGVLVGLSLSQLPHFFFWTISKIKFYVGKFGNLFSSSVADKSYANRCDLEMANGAARRERSDLTESRNEIREIYLDETLI